jgi:hypothetical protein
MLVSVIADYGNYTLHGFGGLERGAAEFHHKHGLESP